MRKKIFEPTNGEDRGVKQARKSYKSSSSLVDLTKHNRQIGEKRLQDKKPFSKHEQKISFYTSNFATAAEYARENDIISAEFFLKSLQPSALDEEAFPHVYRNIRSELKTSKHLKREEPFETLYKQFVAHARAIGYSDNSTKKPKQDRNTTREPLEPNIQ